MSNQYVADCIVCGRMLRTGWKANGSNYYSCGNENCIKYNCKNNLKPKVIQKIYP